MGEFESVAVTHRDGVTELRLHSGGGSLLWNAAVHRELGDALAAVAADRATKVVLVTGTGDTFCAGIDRGSFSGGDPWEVIYWEGKRMIKGLLDLDVPVIGAVNGPAFIHAEIPLLSDVVLAADSAVFADKTHFTQGSVPGDGVHLIWPYLLGPRRGKYFLMTAQEISAAEGLRLGIVNEVVPADALMDRAWELALTWAEKPLPLLRYTREALNILEREHLLTNTGLSHGLALEGVGKIDAPRTKPPETSWPTPTS
jgi:enoyl-CoA hydratase/carnithine racemase